MISVSIFDSTMCRCIAPRLPRPTLKMYLHSFPIFLYAFRIRFRNSLIFFLTVSLSGVLLGGYVRVIHKSPGEKFALSRSSRHTFLTASLLCHLSCSSGVVLSAAAFSLCSLVPNLPLMYFCTSITLPRSITFSRYANFYNTPSESLLDFRHIIM